MWFEVNVRLSEVTDLKWPHWTEWQCGNSTLAMSWPNHAKILSFASMASRQVAVKHGLVSKIAGGCSSYDVIAPWPVLVIFFFKLKVAQGLPHKEPQNSAALRAVVFSLSAKSFRGVCTPPVLARVNPGLAFRKSGSTSKTPYLVIDERAPGKEASTCLSLCIMQWNIVFISCELCVSLSIMKFVSAVPTYWWSPAYF